MIPHTIKCNSETTVINLEHFVRIRGISNPNNGLYIFYVELKGSDEKRFAFSDEAECLDQWTKLYTAVTQKR